MHYVIQYEIMGELDLDDKKEFVSAVGEPGLYEEYIRDLFDFLRPLVDHTFEEDKSDGPVYCNAVENGQIKMHDLLSIGKGFINPRDVDQFGRTFLIRLILDRYHDWQRYGNWRNAIINFITQFGYDCYPEAVDNTGMNALCWACKYNMNDVAEKLLDVFGLDNFGGDWKLQAKAHVLARDNKMTKIADRLMI